MVSAGRICPLPKGDWSEEETYDFLDFVNYNGKTYIAKKVTTGTIPPSNTEDWQLFAGSVDSAMQYVSSIPFASLETATKTKGYVYNISDAFTTTLDFIEGAGHGYAAGANVMWLGDPDNKWDVLSGNRDIATISVELPLESWSGEAAPFSCTIVDPSIHDRTTVIVSALSGSTPSEQYKPYKKAFALLLNATVGEGTATFYASAVPATAFTVNLLQGA